MSSQTPLQQATRPSPRLRHRTSTVDSQVLQTPLLAKSNIEDPNPKRQRRIVTPAKETDDYDEIWMDLKVKNYELRPSATLTTGQCFHWKAITPSEDGSEDGSEGNSRQSAWGTHNATEWVGTLRESKTGQSIVLVIRETPTTTLYKVLHAPPNFDVRAFLQEYFQLNESLGELYKYWSQRDERLSRIAECIPGMRIINQDPWECLASFICSSNNNIPRITKILSSIRREYGNLLIPEGEHGMNEPIYSFPSLKELKQKANDKDLRQKCGIGYRAKYIIETMTLLDSLGGEPYLHKLKEGQLSPAQVQEEMIKFAGCGRKVADCVALFSLNQPEACPVDVHVWNIACRDYDPQGKLRRTKSLTPTVYREVEEIFRSRFQKKAGWAQSLLFVAELPSYRPVLPADIVEEMDNFRKKSAKQKRGQK